MKGTVNPKTLKEAGSKIIKIKKKIRITRLLKGKCMY